MEEEQRELSVEEMFKILRPSMGHTWPVGTFNKEAAEPIEGEFRVVEANNELVSKARRLPRGK